jgi:RND superfamily putative drug exporter
VVRRPRLVIVVWFLLLGILAAQGSGLEQKISTSPIFVDGSEAEREHTVSLREFGSDSTLIVMLRGPQAAVDRQGRALAGDLEAMPSTLVNSPWGSGQTIGGLRPQPGVAALVVSVGKSAGTASDNPVLQVERRIHATVSRPVRTSIAGGLVLSDALNSAAAKASTTAERLAIPVLLIVLLLVCRSFIAALMPLVIGAMVVGATKGVLELCAGMVRMDSFALGAAGMFGLALGVDYSLLVVSRFREERERGGAIDVAVERTVLAAGRSIIPAGCGLVLAMVVSTLVLPSAVISSVALAVIVASILSVLSAIFMTPAILMRLGKHLDRWSLPRRKQQAGLALRWTQRLSRRPAMVLGVVFALFLSGVWALTLQTKIGAVVELPPSNASRIQHEDIQHTLGEGWVAPLEVTMSVHNDGPVTTPKRLAALTTFQRRVEADPGVATMAGFSPVHRAARQFAKLGPGLHQQQRGLVRLGKGVSGVKAGAVASTNGLFSAQEGAQQIDSALGETGAGSSRLAAGLRSTAKGSEKLNGGLARADTGSGKLASGASKSSAGAGKLAKALSKASEQAGEVGGSSRVLKNALDSGEQSLTGLPEAVQTSEERLLAAQQALQRMTTGRGDPQYAAAVAAVEEASRGLGGEGSEGAGVKAGIEHAQGQFSLGLYLAAREAKSGHKSEVGIAKLAKSANRLDRGLDRLAASSQDVSDGIAELSQGGEGLSPGLRKLTSSAERLAGGLGEIGSGAEELVGGIGEGAQRSTRLSSALRRIGFGVRRLQGPGGEGQFHQLDVQSPGLFKSGYFYLAGLVGSKDKKRQQIGYLMNLGDGASTARMLIVPRDDPNTGAAEDTQERLRERAAELEKEAGAEVLIGGLSPTVVALNTELRDDALIARLALSIVTILILLFVTRSLVLPLIAAALNLITVSATFGLLALLFNGSLLGGPGYVDTVIVPASIILIFGLAIDYEVFIFARIREEYLRTGSTSEAISEGVGQSASVVTGAALVMIAVFLAFAVSPLSTLRASGVALAIAVFIDAFLIRFVILPATMRALGDRSWWMPRWLDRLLPGGGPAAVVAEEG